MPDPRTLPSAPVAEIERHIRWPALPAILFLGILVALGVVAALGIRSRSSIISGLPDDPDVRAAADLVRGRLRVDVGALRFRSALLGENAVADPRAASDDHSRTGTIDAGAARGPEGAAGEPGGAGSHETAVGRVSSTDDRLRLAKAAAYLNRARARSPRELRIAAAAASLDLARGELE